MRYLSFLVTSEFVVFKDVCQDLFYKKSIKVKSNPRKRVNIEKRKRNEEKKKQDVLFTVKNSRWK